MLGYTRIWLDLISFNIVSFPTKKASKQAHSASIHSLPVSAQEEELTEFLGRNLISMTFTPRDSEFFAVCVCFFFFSTLKLGKRSFQKNTGHKRGYIGLCVFCVCGKGSKGKKSTIFLLTATVSLQRKRFMKGSTFINDAVAKQSGYWNGQKPPRLWHNWEWMSLLSRNTASSLDC